MKLSALLLAAFSGLAMASPPEFEPLRQELLPSGSFDVIEVHAKTPSRYLTGYLPDTKACALLVNMDVAEIEEPLLTISLAHEAGHCYALRTGNQDINQRPTRYGEAFGDVFGLAWMARHRPDLYQAAASALMQQRMRDRRVNQIYDTLLPMKQAMAALPTVKDPLTFTLDLLKD
jgi:hypothetical protein